jgi:formate hydrogenlyase subunit 4
MIHEVIILDHSGPDLALILLASALKLAIFSALVAGVFVSMASASGGSALALMLAGLVLVAVCVGVVESVMARLRLNRVPQLLVGSGALALFAVILLLR